MNVRLEITVEETREAVREWLIRHERFPPKMPELLDDLLTFAEGVAIDCCAPNAKLQDPMFVVEYTVTRPT